MPSQQLTFLLGEGKVEYEVAIFATDFIQCDIIGYSLASEHKEITQPGCDKPANTKACMSLVINTSKAKKFIVVFNVTALGGASVNSTDIVIDVQEPPTSCSQDIGFKSSQNQ